MKKKKKKIVMITMITIIIVIAIGSFMILIKNDMSKRRSENNREDEQNSNENEVIVEEEITPSYKIYIPQSAEECHKDDCITNETLEKINDYIKSNYEILEQKEHTYISKDDEHIELVYGSADEEIDRNAYKYIITSKTKIDDVKVMLGEEIVIEEEVKQDDQTLKTPPKTPPKTPSVEYASQIAILNYHFFYNPQKEECNESICLGTDNFEKQLKYLKDNDFKTLTMEEFRAWMYNEIELPKKSVLLTIDDGAMGTSKINGNKLIPLLEKYELNATLFLITGWWKKENYQSNYLDVQSHGNLIHVYQTCNDGASKPKLQCLSYEQLKEDLEASISKLDSNTSFCFPFYSYNDTSMNVLKDLGFKLAFIGGNAKATRKNNKYTIPRYVIYKDTSLNAFINMIN